VGNGSTSRTRWCETLRAEVVDLEVSLGVGDGAARAYGCDLTAGYVEENAAYYSS